MCLSELCTEQILWWQHVRPCGCQSEGASPCWWILVPGNQTRGGRISSMKQSWFHNIHQKVRKYPSQLKRTPLIPQILTWQSRILLSIPQLEEDKDLHKDWPWLGKVVDRRNGNTKIGKGHLCRGASCQNHYRGGTFWWHNRHWCVVCLFHERRWSWIYVQSAPCRFQQPLKKLTAGF